MLNGNKADQKILSPSVFTECDYEQNSLQLVTFSIVIYEALGHLSVSKTCLLCLLYCILLLSFEIIYLF